MCRSYLALEEVVGARIKLFCEEIHDIRTNFEDWVELMAAEKRGQ